MAIDFGGFLDRKYANQDLAARSEAGLRDAQAQGILGSQPSENALRLAQAFSAREQGKTISPLAQASIASTNAGIGETQARTGLLGAQTQQIGFDTFAPATPEERLQYRYGTNQSGFGFNSNLGTVGDGTSRSVLDRPTALGNTTTPLQGNAGGATNVQPMKGKQAQPKGKPMAKGKAPPQQMAQQQMPPQLLDPATGGVSLHGIMQHALGTLRAAGGAADVPAPGQTITSGSWTGPAGPATPAPAPLPPTPATGGDLRRRLGLGVVRAAGGETTVPSIPAPGQTTTNGSWEGPTNVPPPPPATTLTPVTGPRTTFGRRVPVSAAGGATDVQNYKGGTAMVPGKGAPNVDSVPSLLAPQEAVLNAGAAHTLGRGAIALLNAHGAAKMAQAGMPPQTPPSAHGTLARGMPKAGPAKKPSDQQKRDTKAPPPKVAAAGKGK